MSPAPSLPDADAVDCAIIGAGPAGLTAAIYLARFHLTIRLFDCGSSRAAMIPRTHNHAGFPGGITGPDLLARMHRQARDHGATCEAATVTAIARDDEAFVVRTDRTTLGARTVLLATGVVNHRPAGLGDALHDAALARGLLRYCPICDGYEVTDRRVGVIGTGDHGMREALFLRGYTRDVTLIAPDTDHQLDDACRAALDDAGIRGSTARAATIASTATASSCVRRTASRRSTVFIPRSGRVSAPSLPWRRARGRPTMAVSRSTITSGPRSPACSRRAMW